jgi:hypothetical protein
MKVIGTIEGITSATMLLTVTVAYNCGKTSIKSSVISN